MLLPFLLLLASIPIPPSPLAAHLTPSALFLPLQLPLLPSSTFVNLPPAAQRNLDISRALERLAWAYAVLALLSALYRLAVRGSRSGRGVVRGPGVMALGLHMLSWRLAMLPLDGKGEGGTEAWEWPWDVGSFLGLVGGVGVGWGEVALLFGLLGVTAGAGSLSRPARVGHGVLSAHRLLLAVRVVSATLSTPWLRHMQSGQAQG